MGSCQQVPLTSLCHVGSTVCCVIFKVMKTHFSSFVLGANSLRRMVQEAVRLFQQPPPPHSRGGCRSREGLGWSSPVSTGPFPHLPRLYVSSRVCPQATVCHAFRPQSLLGASLQVEVSGAVLLLSDMAPLGNCPVLEGVPWAPISQVSRDVRWDPHRACSTACCCVGDLHGMASALSCPGKPRLGVCSQRLTRLTSNRPKQGQPKCQEIAVLLAKLALAVMKKHM